MRAVGLSSHDTRQLEAAENLSHIDTLQPPFSAVRRDAAGSVLPWCHAQGTGVIVYSPMQAGLLTGGFTAERARALPKDDWRSRNAEFTGEKLERNLKLAATLAPVTGRYGASTAALAWPGVNGGIVGACSPEQVDG